ncbi:MAG: AAC(3) family N-acetyltransferase [Chloroflexota bacterium]
MTTVYEIRSAVNGLGLSGQFVCLHTSLRSLGKVDGGARSVVDAFLSERCTLLVPAFSWKYAVSAPNDRRIERNGRDDAVRAPAEQDATEGYSVSTVEIDSDMGAVAAAVVRSHDRVRGNHPLCSFAAVGELADPLVTEQQPLDAMAPMRQLADANGFVLLAGVGLSSMTLLHWAEQLAGRSLFRRWALDANRHAVEVETGGCSAGFGNLETAVGGLAKEAQVGRGLWRAFPAAEAARLASDAIRRDPAITHCADTGCARCNDAVLGGPLL